MFKFKHYETYRICDIKLIQKKYKKKSEKKTNLFIALFN